MLRNSWLGPRSKACNMLSQFAVNTRRPLTSSDVGIPKSLSTTCGWSISRRRLRFGGGVGVGLLSLGAMKSAFHTLDRMNKSGFPRTKSILHSPSRKQKIHVREHYARVHAIINTWTCNWKVLLKYCVLHSNFLRCVYRFFRVNIVFIFSNVCLNYVWLTMLASKLKPD